uniref:Ig-like domain-containing protein n=1 Tax=Pelusios castaneus TaxID=367368 RepID=A0A8C8SBH4_9SAUR
TCRLDCIFVLFFLRWPLLFALIRDVCILQPVRWHLCIIRTGWRLRVRWFRSKLLSFVHLYHGGKDQYEGQMPEYRGRTELLKAELTDGNVDLRILNIRPSDEGQYICFVQDGSFYDETVLELWVAGQWLVSVVSLCGLGSAPLISIEGHEDGGLQVVCRSAGWYPEPEVLWKDLNGRHLPTASETKSQVENRLFIIETAVIVREQSSQRLSCYIRNTVLNQEKESAIYIAGELWQDGSSTPGRNGASVVGQQGAYRNTLPQVNYSMAC